MYNDSVLIFQRAISRTFFTFIGFVSLCDGLYRAWRNFIHFLFESVGGKGEMRHVAPRGAVYGTPTRLVSGPIIGPLDKDAL